MRVTLVYRRRSNAIVVRRLPLHGPIDLLLALWLRERPLLATGPPEAPGGRVFHVGEMTLVNAPNIALAQSQLLSAAGAALFAAGRFDPVVGHSLAWGESRTPLTPTSTEDARTIAETISYSQE